MAYPITKDTFPSVLPMSSRLGHSSLHNQISIAVRALEDKIGINASTDAASFDYILKNPLSVSPGHKHSYLEIIGLGTSAQYDFGTGANNIVMLDSFAKLPAVDGSQLINLPNMGGDVFGLPSGLVVDGELVSWNGTDGKHIKGTGILSSTIALAIVNSHTHANKALLDTYTQTEANLASAVSLKHTHSNKPLLDSLTSAGGGTLFLANDGTYKAPIPPSIAWGDIIGLLLNQTDLVSALNAKQDALGFTPENSANKDQAGGYAGLDLSGKLNPSQIPAIAITDTFVVNSQAAMLALIAQTGDVAIRTDQSKSYILQGTDPSILGNWQELLTPISPVQSVFGRTGVVTAQNGDYNSDQVNEGSIHLYDKVVAILAGAGIGVTGTYPNFTITNASPDQIVALTQGTGITISGTYPNFTITNSSPDQTVSLTAGSNVTITGTYPNFTITSIPPDLSAYFKALYGGCITGHVYTDNGNGTINVPSMDVNLWDNSTFQGVPSKYTLAAVNNMALTDGVMNYVVGDYNGGSPIQKVITDVSLITESNVVPLLSIFRNGNLLHAQNWDALGIGLANKIHQSIVKTQRYRRESGLALSESGTRNLDLTAGRVWVGAVPVDLASIATSTDNMFFWYHSAGTWTSSTVTQYNNTQYDNGTNLVALTSNRYAVNWIYRGVEISKHLYCVIGNGDYTLQQALDSTEPPKPINISSHAVLVGRVIVQNGSNTAQSIRSAFDTTFGSAGITSHTDLTNLDFVNSGHTGTANTVIMFNNSGVPAYVKLGQSGIPSVSSIASSGTPSIDVDRYNSLSITALAANITSVTVTGTPIDFQKLLVRIKDNGSARTIAWGASFEAKGQALPTTTIIGKVLTVGFIYDSVSLKWGCIAVAQES